MNMRLGIPFFLFVGDWHLPLQTINNSTVLIRKRRDDMKEETSIIAYRRSCSVEGTGLSHFILMERE